MLICNTVRWPIKVGNTCSDGLMMQVKGRKRLDGEQREEEVPKEVRRW